LQVHRKVADGRVELEQADFHNTKVVATGDFTMNLRMAFDFRPSDVKPGRACLLLSKDRIPAQTAPAWCLVL
jgi:hypothetical protein